MRDWMQRFPRRLRGDERGSKTSGVTYHATTRTLTMGTNASVTLGGGTYNVCSIAMGNNDTLTVAAGATVRIFLDSPERTGSGCTATGAGTWTMGNNMTMNNSSQLAQNLQIYIYGFANPLDPRNEIDFANNGTLYAAMNGPQSTLVFKNNGVMNGGIAARVVEFKNNLQFNWDSSLTDLRSRNLVLYYRTAWHECRSAPSVSSDPGSGC